MLQKLIDYLKPYLSEGICIAFSGGTDSTLLLKAACLAQEEALRAGTLDEASCRTILALVAETRLHPHEDTTEAIQLAKSIGADCRVLSIDEFDDPHIMQNPKNRCYLCKRLLFSSIKKTALEEGCHTVLDGTNIDDTKVYRPGLTALKELNIISPLKELSITKEQVRELSAKLQLPTSDKPSAPCMATRLPYGARLDYDLLDRIHIGETKLRALGFYNVRLRYHEPLLRIEVDTDDLSKLVENRSTIIAELKALGFSYLTLDLEGFRSGSMDIDL